MIANIASAYSKFSWVVSRVSANTNKSVHSEDFAMQIALENGKTIETKWNFNLTCYSEHFGFYLYKNFAESDDVDVKFKCFIRKLNGEGKLIRSFEIKSEEFKTNNGWGWDNLCDANTAEIMFLQNDTLIFDLEIELLYNKVSEHNHAKYFMNTHLSDYTIVTKSHKKIPVHGMVLAENSPVFEAMLSSNLKETVNKEIHISDFDDDVLKEFLRFIYTGTVENINEHAEKLLDAAEKYDLPNLKMLCASALGYSIGHSNALHILAVAELYDEKILVQRCMEYITSNYWYFKASKLWSSIKIQTVLNFYNNSPIHTFLKVKSSNWIQYL